MSGNVRLVARVALVAANAGGIEALRPTRDLLDAFGIGWSEALVPVEGAATFPTEELRALVVASPDASLPGALAAETRLPVVRVPVASDSVAGLDLLRDPATDDLPAGGGAFATVAIGEAGAKNAALFIVSVLALEDPRLRAEWIAYRQRQTDAVLASAPLDAH